MLYALDRINEDSSLLPDIKLGAILLDSCSSSTYALNQSLEFIRASINTVESSAFECKDKSTPRPKYGSKMIAGVIGGSYSEVSLQVANLLRLFRIPQVSSWARESVFPVGWPCVGGHHNCKDSFTCRGGGGGRRGSVVVVQHLRPCLHK